MPINKKLFPFKIGADPEFNIVFDEDRLSAKNTLRVLLDKNKKIKYNDDKLGYELKNKGVIGWDGENGTGELRPAPANSPKRLTTNIGNLIGLITEKSTLFTILTSSLNAPIGGHIHIEITEEMQTKMTQIHKKLASYYIPLMLGEDCINMRIRNRSNYGLINDFRIQTVNNNGINAKTYEFRTPSAEWLTTPKICEATLAYIATVFHEITNNPENFNKTKNIIYKNEKQGEALQNLALTKYASLSETINNKIKKALKTFEYYPTYKKQIDYIMNAKKVLKDKEKVNFNMIQGWEMQKIKTPTKRDLMNETKINKILTEIDADKFGKLIKKITHNKNDQNAILFKNTIKNRILAYNWKIKNEYYIFGLRKGVNEMIVFDGTFEIFKNKPTIKNKSELRIVNSIFTKIIDKIIRQTSNTSPEHRDDKYLKRIFIGVPYEDRINMKTRKFIELIYQIETNKIKSKVLNMTDLPEANMEKPTQLIKTYQNTEIDLIDERRADTEIRNTQIAKEETIREEQENQETTYTPHYNNANSTTGPN